MPQPIPEAALLDANGLRVRVGIDQIRLRRQGRVVARGLARILMRAYATLIAGMILSMGLPAVVGAFLPGSVLFSAALAGALLTCLAGSVLLAGAATRELMRWSDEDIVLSPQRIAWWRGAVSLEDITDVRVEHGERRLVLLTGDTEHVLAERYPAEALDALKQVISSRVRERRSALLALGHDLSTPAVPPASLDALRST